MTNDPAQLEKRKRVMARSIKLGHCVCDPRKPCPCDTLRERNVCTCAGERIPAKQDGGPVRLTDYVRSAGCASKIGQKDLHDVLSRLPRVEDPRLVVGMATADDAGVFRLSPGVTIVQTVDVFTPGVDDPYVFGRIAACNSLSDVYAMGGKPVTALSIIGFPIESLPPHAMAEIIRGGMDTLKAAGAVLLGGHSINDEEVKFGFAVTGIVREGELVTNAGAKPGDVLVLTKPLGTGIVSLAERVGRASRAAVEAAMASMSALNHKAAEIMVKHRASACTDVTGFGLIGHLSRMVLESRVTAELAADLIPVFPGVMDYAQQGIFTGANERNAEYSRDYAFFDADVPDAVRAVCFDAQTSGGLLIAFPPAEAEPALLEMRAAGLTAAAIGRITCASEGRIHVRHSAEEPESGRPAEVPREEKRMSETPIEDGEVCCAPGAEPTEDSVRLFKTFMSAAMAPGSLDAVTKQYLAVALALAVNCVPCARMHIRRAREMGIAAAELDEAAALAVAFGGCRVLMLWNDLKKELGSCS